MEIFPIDAKFLLGMSETLFVSYFNEHRASLEKRYGRPVCASSRYIDGKAFHWTGVDAMIQSPEEVHYTVYLGNRPLDQQVHLVEKLKPGEHKHGYVAAVIERYKLVKATEEYDRRQALLEKQQRDEGIERVRLEMFGAAK